MDEKKTERTKEQHGKISLTYNTSPLISGVATNWH